jgi:hypothetical protein
MYKPGVVAPPNEVGAEKGDFGANMSILSYGPQTDRLDLRQTEENVLETRNNPGT